MGLEERMRGSPSGSGSIFGRRRERLRSSGAFHIRFRRDSTGQCGSARRGPLELCSPPLSGPGAERGLREHVRRSPAIEAVLSAQPRIHPWVFTNARTAKPFKSVRQVFDRAVPRAGIATGDVTFHTLRHTALSRMIEAGFDDHTVMAISGHSSTRMLERSPTRGKNGRSGRWTCRGWAQSGHKTKLPPRATPRRRLKSQNCRGKLVDRRRIELLTSALRTRRSPS